MNKQATMSKIISVDALDVSFTSMEEGTRDRKGGVRKISVLDRSDHTDGTSPTMLSRHGFWNRSNRSLWNRSNRSLGNHSNHAISMEIDEEGEETKGKVSEIGTKSLMTMANMKRVVIFYVVLLYASLIISCSINKANMHKKSFRFSGLGFRTETDTVLAGIRTELYSTLNAADAFVISMVSQAKASKQIYPFVMIDDFDLQAERLLAHTQAKYISTHPVINEGEHQKWLEYTKNQNLESDALFGNEMYGSDNSSQYLSTCQYTSAIPIDPINNCNFSFNKKSQGLSLGTTEKHKVTITEPYFSHWPDNIIHQEYDVERGEIPNQLKCGEGQEEAFFDIYYPVFDTLDSIRNQELEHSVEDKNLAAYLRITIRWQDILGSLLSPESKGVVAVFNNSCAKPFAFEITGRGPPRYLEMEQVNLSNEYNRSSLDNMIFEQNSGIENIPYKGTSINQESCPYKISVYPSEYALKKFSDFLDGIDTGDFSINPGCFVMYTVMGLMGLTIIIVGLFFYFSGRVHRDEIQAKSDLLEAKRNFVRFVSHEVRTPLNVVCMGLTLILQEFKKREKELQNKKDANGDENKHKDSVVEKKNLIRWSCMAEEVSNSIDIAVGVLNDLLNIDKIQMGNFKLEMEALPVWELIEETVSEFSMMAERQNTDLELDLSALLDPADIESGGITNASMLPPSILRKIVVGDGQRLRQVLRNLLSNAIKFSENRSVTVKVSSTGFKDNRFFGNKLVSKARKEFELADGIRKSFPRSGRIIVDVIDTGVGMTPFELEKVFNMGTQFHAKEQQSGGGSGLGLTFSKAIVEQLGGSLRALSSGRDKGTTLRLDLPLYTSDSDCCSSEQIVFTPTSPTRPEEPPKVAPRKKVSLRPSRRRHRKAERRHSNPEAQKDLEPMTMLVVDDDTMSSKFMVKMLESYGHTCDRLKNGQELVDAFNENPAGYDCILLDYEMPIMNGPEACKIVREMGRTNFVVGVTGNLLPEDIGHFIECGADTVLPKPLKYEELKELLIEYGIGIPIDSNSGHFEATTTSRRSFCRRGTM